MRSLINLKLTIAFALALSLPAFAQNAQPQLSDLAWIAGCWEIDQPEKKRLVTEQWMAPAGDAMIGMSRTMRNGKMAGFEYLRIVRDATGINYISKPSENKDETAFKLIKWSAGSVVFENPTHDFPQRIIYNLTKPDALAARVEGTMNGKLTGVDFPMKRAKCG
jgi:hypothetical protein